MVAEISRSRERAAGRPNSPDGLTVVREQRVDFDLRWQS